MTRVLVVGATGLLGSQLVDGLCKTSGISQIRCLVRKKNTPLWPNVDVQPVDFMNLDNHHRLFDGITHVICCVGTTMKTAKSTTQFQLVDHYIPKEVARISKAKGISNFSLVTSLGANSRSPLFYFQVKGAIEDHIAGMGFDSLIIYRPSLLLGKRREFRWTEALMGIGFRLFSWGIPRSLAPTDSAVLAKRMIADIKCPAPGVSVVGPMFFSCYTDANETD
jgi:uncharacterized protein YbjT (DUF2867 family)